MTASPLALETFFRIGPVPVTQPVFVTSGIVLAAALFAIILQNHLALRPGKIQAFAELVVSAIDHQISEVMQGDPASYRALIGTIFLFVLLANWSSLVPGLEPPTAHLETDAALALIVLAATIYFGISKRGLVAYLRTFAQPTWVMIPLNVVEQLTRTFSLVVRLFGNVMSGVFIIGIILTLAGLFVPIPLMALDLLTGAVQAYIFAILSCVFIAAAVSEQDDENHPKPKKGDTK